MVPVAGLTGALQWLDRLLERAISVAAAAADAAPVEDRFRGLYVGSDEVQQMLARAAGQLPPWSRDPDDPPELTLDDAVHPLDLIERTFSLEPFDLAVLLIALAPDLDLRYERIYAYLQDDVSRRRPTVDLVLNLLCGSPAEKRSRLASFSSAGLLLRHGLISLIPDGHSPHAALLAHAVRVDEQIVGFAVGYPGIDSRLTPFTELRHPSESLDTVPLDAPVRRSLRALFTSSERHSARRRLYLRGHDTSLARSIAAGLAADDGRPLLRIDCRGISPAESERLAPVAFREAWFRNAIVHLDRVDLLAGDDRAAGFRAWARAATSGPVETLLSGRRPWASLDSDDEPLRARVFEVAMALPGHGERRLWWKRCLADNGIRLDSEAIEMLSARFHLTGSQIAGAAASISSQAVWERSVEDLEQAAPGAAAPPTLADAFATARAQCTMEIGAAARKITPVHGWADIILSPAALQQLRELCARVTHRHVVFGEWGFDRTLSMGRGVTALFSGATGTGKTMAAEIVARELGLDLYKIDLAGVVSKYIGETEKNLDRVFTAAEHANAILFFDEADALFGKRSEVRDSHDRYANIEISYLLQKMDQYEGVAILATNLRENMDDAFVRRLQFVIEFSFPDEAHRLTLWSALFPPETPRADDLDFPFLAKQFRLTGGHIKNIVLGASYLAAGNGGRVEMSHLVRATWRECEKLGRSVTPDDFGRYAGNVP